MAYNEAQKRATMKYQKEHMEQLAIRVRKGDRQALKEEAERCGQSMAEYVCEAVNEKAGRKVISSKVEES